MVYVYVYKEKIINISMKGKSRLYSWVLYNLLWQNPKFSEFYHLKQKQAALNLMTKTHLKYPEKSVKISSCMSKFLQSV